MYNTETANYIGSHRSDCYKNDFRYFEEDLYQKKTKEFFLYGGWCNDQIRRICSGMWLYIR